MLSRWADHSTISRSFCAICSNVFTSSRLMLFRQPTARRVDWSPPITDGMFAENNREDAAARSQRFVTRLLEEK